MANFEIFRNSNGKTAAVKRGFSWAGLLFGPIWTAAEGLWLISALLFAANVICAFGVIWLQAAFQAGGSAEALFEILLLIIAIYTGWAGNDWRVAKLKRKGYRKVGMVEAKSEHKALAKPDSSEDEVLDAFQRVWGAAKATSPGTDKKSWAAVEARLQNGARSADLLIEISRLSFGSSGDGDGQGDDPRLEKAWETLRQRLG